MGAPEVNTTLIYGIHVRESANDGSDFTNAAADYRILFLGEDGLLHTKDSSGTVDEPWTGGGGTGQGLVDYGFAQRTAGNITTNNTSWTDVTGPLEVTVSASTADRLECCISGGAYGTEAVTLNLTMMSIVSASPVNDIATGTSPSNTTLGVGAWRAASGAPTAFGGGMIYAVQAGDISGGSVTLRLRYRSSSATNRVLTASDPPLFIYVKNLGAAM